MNNSRRNTSAPLTLLLVIFFAGLVAVPLAADPYHYVNTFIGDRAAGMAGAYTAIADGPEGMYYNPAGLAFSPANYISVSTNAFEFRNWTFEDIKDTGVDFNRNSSTFVPNFFGFVQRGRNLVWGFTIYNPDSESVNLRDSFDFDINTSYSQEKYYNEDRETGVTAIGPAVGVLMGDSLGIGFALRGIQTKEESIQREVNQILDTSDALIAQQQSEILSTSQVFAVEAQLGLQYVPTSSLAVGYSGTATVPLYGTSGVTTNSTYVEGVAGLGAALGWANVAGDFSVSSSNIVDDGIFSAVTVSNRLGVAWFASQRLIVAADGSFVVPINPEGTSSDQEKKPTWNAAVGMEYYLTQNYPLRLGVFTNNANTDTVDTEKTDQPEHVDIYGATVSIGFATSDLMLNIGGSYSMGVGKGQIIGGDTDIQTLNRSSAAVFISGGYQF